MVALICLLLSSVILCYPLTPSCAIYAIIVQQYRALRQGTSTGASCFGLVVIEQFDHVHVILATAVVHYL